MKRNAHSVVRIDKTVYTISSYDKASLSKKYAITVLNAKASSAGNISLKYTEGIDEVKNLKIRIYNSKGELVKKVKKKEISDASVYDGFSMANDLRSLNYTSTYSTYPYTIEYEFEEESKFTAFIKPWYPISYYNSSVEYSSYKINKPENIKINFKNRNHNTCPDKLFVDGINFEFTAKNLNAIEAESKMPQRVVPSTIFSTDKSILGNTEVTYKDWESFGKWMYEAYLNDKNNLNESARQEVRKVVGGLENKYEIAKKVYEMSIHSTRYVSIQLGEGGWEPFYAQETHDRKYGDCKALSMYTLSMMKAVGLDAFYVIISAGSNYKSDLEVDFPSIQGNHAIIGIPIEGDTIYADCTSRANPFAYRSGFTDGRVALAINESGGKIIRTPEYSDRENSELITSKLKVDINNKILTIETSNELSGLRIGSRLFLDQYKERQILEKVYPSFYPQFQKETFLDLKFDLLDEKTFKESFRVENRSLISQAGDYILIPLHVHSTRQYQLDKERDFDIYVKEGSFKEFNYSFEIPLGYETVKLPEAFEFETKTGNCKFQIVNASDEEVSYTVSILATSGTFSKTDVSEYNAWVEAINKLSKIKLTLKKL